MLRIAALLGKPVAIAQHTLDKKVFSNACICVEIDLNNPLLNSLEFFFGSSSWVQPLDYESLPFRCQICHEYGHLQFKCLLVNKSVEVSSPPPLGPGMEKGNRDKAPMTNGALDKDGFIPIMLQAKGRGQKQPFEDRKSEANFNRFEVLDNLALEEGIPVEVSSRANAMGSDMVLEQVVVVRDKAQV